MENEIRENENFWQHQGRVMGNACKELESYKIEKQLEVAKHIIDKNSEKQINEIDKFYDTKKNPEAENKDIEILESSSGTFVRNKNNKGLSPYDIPPELLEKDKKTN